MRRATVPRKTNGTKAIEREQGKVRQLFEQLREEILKQRRKPGDKLPGTRQLAKQLSISRNGVTTAFEMLAAEGLVIGRVGAGTFVSQDSGAAKPSEHRTAKDLPRLSQWAQALPLEPHIIPSKRVKIDFRPGRPNRIGLEACYTPMRRAIGRLARSNIAGADANDPAGRPRLRGLLASHLRSTRGLACEPADIILTSGSHQSLDMIARLFGGVDSKIAIEDPCYPLAPRLFRANGFSVAAVAVDEHGIDVSRIAPDVCLVYATPNHQFPMGYRLSPQRRVELLELASRQNSFVIEDDYEGELYATGNQRTCLKADDQQDRVIYLGSYSKYLFPQLRIGFIVAPKCLRDLLIRAHWLIDRQVSLPVQLCLESLVESGDFLKIVRRSERDYQIRADLLRHLIKDHLGSHFNLPPSAGGFQIAALTDTEFDVAEFVQNAFNHGVGIYCLADFALESNQNGIVFGLADLAEDEIKEGVRILRQLIESRIGTRKRLFQKIYIDAP